MNLDTPAATVATRIEPAADPGLAATLHAGQAAADGLTFLRGSLVGRYVVLERIGAGAMGVVFAAYDPELDRKVALKFLRADNADPEARTRLLREAQAMARLAHPNVVAVHDVGTFGGEVFVAMEFVQGVTLRHWLAGPPRGWRETVAVFVAAGRGLAAAHEAGLVHRDLKPENIMIGADERVRVMDFGLARASGRDDGEPPSDTPSREQALALELTRTGALVGTPAYMAPEQWERQESDARSDQFSFCVALWEALYGERPFRGETLAALMLAVTGGRPRAPGDPRRAPGWARRLLERGLSTDPAARWPSMAVLLSELTQDRRTALRRWSAASVGIVALLAAGLGAQQVLEKRAAADAERERAERAETDATAAHTRAEREAFERTTLAEAQRSGEVLRLATTGGRERDALVLGVQVLAPFGPTFDDAPRAAVEGLARALPALIPRFTRTSDDPIEQMLFSPDAARLVVVTKATKSFNGSDEPSAVHVWSSRTGEHLSEFDVGPIERAALSPDGRLLATSGTAAGLWDLMNGTRRHGLGRYRNLVFSADGATIFGIAEKGPLTSQPERLPTAIVAWDTVSGVQRWSLPLRGYMYDQVKIFAHPMRSELIVKLDGATAGRVLRLDGVTGKERGRPARAAGPRERSIAALSGSGRLLISAENARDAEPRVLIWDLDAGRVDDVKGLTADRLDAIRISPDERHAVVEGESHGRPMAMILDVRARRLLWSDEGVLSTFGRDALISIDGWSKLSIQDPSSGTTRVEQQLVGRAPQLVASPDGEALAFYMHQSFGVWPLADPAVLERWSPPAGERVQVVGRSVVSTRDPEGVWRLYQAQASSPMVTLLEGRDDGPHVEDDDYGDSLGPNGGWIVSRPKPGAASNRARYLDASQGRILLDLKDYGEHRYWLTLAGAPMFDLDRTPWPVIVDPRRPASQNCVLRPAGGDPWLPSSTVYGISQDGAYMLQSNMEGDAEIWRSETCERIWKFHISKAWSDPQYIRLLGSDHVFIGDSSVLDTLTGREKFRLDDRCWQQTRWTPDGEFLWSWCAFSNLGTLWHVPTGMPVGEFDTSMGFMTAFTEDGEHMGVPTREGGFRVIDTVEGEETLHLRTRTGIPPSSRVTFTPDGASIRVKVGDDTVLTYPASRRELIRAACKALAVTDAWAEVSTECSTFEVIAGGD